NGPIKYC
ncbi:unnamed protein product, partial [Allacma fusca]